MSSLPIPDLRNRTVLIGGSDQARYVKIGQVVAFVRDVQRAYDTHTFADTLELVVQADSKERDELAGMFAESTGVSVTAD